MDLWLNHLFLFLSGQLPKELKINQTQRKYIHFSVIHFLVLLSLTKNTIQTKLKKHMATIIRKDIILISASVTSGLLVRVPCTRWFLCPLFSPQRLHRWPGQSLRSSTLFFGWTWCFLAAAVKNEATSAPGLVPPHTGFDGEHLTFRSLWMRPLEWMNSTPLTICLKIERLSFFLSWFWFWFFLNIHCLRVSGEHSSIWI